MFVFVQIILLLILIVQQLKYQIIHVFTIHVPMVELVLLVHSQIKLFVSVHQILMVQIVRLLVVQYAILAGKIYEIYFEKKIKNSFYILIGVTMVVDVLMLMDKHIVHVYKIIVVDDANFDIINITMSIYTIVHIIMVKSEWTFSSMNQKNIILF